MLAAVESARQQPAVDAMIADLAGAVERWAADLSLTEEPARFLAALEDAAPPAAPPA
jgi:hypothetical protein